MHEIFLPHGGERRMAICCWSCTTYRTLFSFDVTSCVSRAPSHWSNGDLFFRSLQGEVSFSKNGKELGVAFKLPSGVRGPFFPAVALKSAQVGRGQVVSRVSPDKNRRGCASSHRSRCVRAFALECGIVGSLFFGDMSARSEVRYDHMARKS